MINPNATVRWFNDSKGSTFEGWITRPKVAEGDRVNIQVQFSITLDRYSIMTANRPRKTTA